MAECRYKGLCRIDFDIDFDVCYPCVGDGADTCFHYEPMPDVKALKGLADEMQGHADAEGYGGDGRINAGCLWSYADRIRDALGASDG